MNFLTLLSFDFLVQQYKLKPSPRILSFSISSAKKRAIQNEFHCKIILLLARQKRQIQTLEYLYNISEDEIVGGSDNDEYFCEFYDRYRLHLHNDKIQDDFIIDFCAFQTSTYLDSLDIRDKYHLLLNFPQPKKPRSKYQKPFPFKI